jgi:hypothetical protein
MAQLPVMSGVLGFLWSRLEMRRPEFKPYRKYPFADTCGCEQAPPIC